MEFSLTKCLQNTIYNAINGYERNEIDAFKRNDIISFVFEVIGMLATDQGGISLD
jgi:hypothetical protein